MTTPVMPAWQVWLRASRPFSLTAAFIPVTLGTVLAWREGYFNLLFYLLAVTVGIMLQIGTNLVNTNYDYINGVDTTASSGDSNPILVMGWLSPPAVIKGGYLAFALAALSGLYLVFLRGWPLLLLGLVGVLGGYGYTARPLAYKYRGLGVPLVFILMGPLMVLGGYVVQTGYWQWTPVLVSLPVGFLVAGIMHGNDLRDVETDRLAAVKTWSHIMGDKSEHCYYFLILGAYLSTILLVVGGLLPWPALLPLVLLQQGIKLTRMVRGGFRGNPALLGPIEPLTANLHLKYGMLFIIGLLLAGTGL